MLTKFIRLTRAADNSVVHVNILHIRAINQEPGGRGAWVNIGENDTIAVSESPERVLHLIEN